MSRRHRRAAPGRHADVIVVGGGVSGLACAAALRRAGLTTVVLEARPRLGGRVWTLHEPGSPLPIELGAEFVHGRPPELLGIARAAGLATHEAGGEAYRAAGGRLRRIERSSMAPAAVLGRLSRSSPDRSVTQALASLRVSARVRADAASFVEGFDAAPPDDTSARWVADGQAQTRDAARRVLRIAAGYDGVVRWLRAQAGEEDAADDVRTGVLVREVEWRRGSVRVHAATGGGGALEPFESERLVVTLPIGVLCSPPDAAGAVRFDPPLAAPHQRALASLAMGAVLRLTLRFRNAFWPAGMSFLRAPTEAVPTFWTAYPFEEPRVVAWAGGRAAQALLALGETRIVDHALGSLSRALRLPRGRVERELAGWWAHDWSADPFARGAYAYARVGGADAARRLSAPAEETLFFAGAAVCEAAMAGTVHGAIASGRSAARALLRKRGS